MESYDSDEALRPLPSVLENLHLDCDYPCENELKPLEASRLSTLEDKRCDALHLFEHHDIVDDGVYNHEAKHEEGIQNLTLNNLDAPRDVYQPSYDGTSSVISSKKRDFGTHSVASQEYSNYEGSYYEIPNRSSRKAYSSVSHNTKRRSITGFAGVEKVPDHDETSDPYSFYNVPNMRQRRQAREKKTYSNSDEKMSSAYLRFKTLNQIHPGKRNVRDTNLELNNSDATLPSTTTSSCFNYNQKHGLKQAIYGQERNFMSANIKNTARTESCYSLPAEYGSHKWRSIYMQNDLCFEPIESLDPVESLDNIEPDTVESLDNIEPLPIHSSGSNIDTFKPLDNIEPLPIHSSGSNMDTIKCLDNIEPLPIHSSRSNTEDPAESEDFSAYNNRADSISPSSLDSFDCDPPLYTHPVPVGHGETLSEIGRDFDRLMTVEDPNELYQMHNNAEYSYSERDFSDPIDTETWSDMTAKEQKDVETKKKPSSKEFKKNLTAKSMLNYTDKVDDPISPIISVFEMQELELGTSFAQLVLSNYCKTLLKEKDAKGMRKSLKEGFAGLTCIHCVNCYNAAKGGRFFPSSIKTISDSRKGLQAFAGHLQKCDGTSIEIKQTLKKLQETHEDERKKMKYGNQKAFFSLIWTRLHGEMKEKLK